MSKFRKKQKKRDKKIRKKKVTGVTKIIYKIQNNLMYIYPTKSLVFFRTLLNKGKKPDFIIAGFQKSGTTSLALNLEKHPDIEMNPYYVVNRSSGGLGFQEPNFFNKTQGKFKQKQYFALFNNNGKKQGEKTPEYILKKETLERIKKICPQTKIIITLRDPVTRAYSQYNHFTEVNLIKNKSFLEKIKENKENNYEENHIVNQGFYEDYLKELFKIFPKKQIKIIISERMKKDMKKTYQELCEFLEIDQFKFEFKTGIHKREYKRDLNQEEIKELYKIYKAHNEKLFKLLGFRIPEWDHEKEKSFTTNKQQSFKEKNNLTNILTNNSNKQEIKKYWKKNEHLFITNNKVGSRVIWEISANHLDFPLMFNKKNNLEKILKKHKKSLTKSSKETERELKKRKIFFLVRCPFHRAISSYEYRLDERFNPIKKEYLKKGIKIDKLNIIEYIALMQLEIEKKNSNPLINHFRSQKELFNQNAFEDSKINLLWQTEKIDELIKIWNEVFKLKINVNKKKNVTIKDKQKYLEPYQTYPELFKIVKKTFKEDLDWLNPIFNYEEKFKEKFKKK